MTDPAPYVPPLPEHPELREIALVIERMGMVGEILDDRFRSVFVSSQTARSIGLSPDEARGLLGMSLIARTFDPDYTEIVRVTEESGNAWTQHNVPIMRRYVQPGDPDFDESCSRAARRPMRRGLKPVGTSHPARGSRHGLVPARALRFRRRDASATRSSAASCGSTTTPGRFLGVAAPRCARHAAGRGLLAPPGPRATGGCSSGWSG